MLPLLLAYKLGFSIFGTFIPYYGFFILLGIVCACSLGFFLCKKLNLNTDDFIIIAAYLFAFGFAGAKILYILVSIKYIDFSEVFKSLESFNNFLGSGFVFYGGLLGGLLALLFVQKVHKIKMNSYIRILAPSLSLAHAFGRIGCSFAGCCYGKATNLPLYFEYSESIVAPNGIKLFPVQGIESFCLFILTIILVILILKNHSCSTHLIYILTYSVLRFILEFFRGDAERGKLFFLSTSQIISLILFFGVIFCFFCNHKVSKKTELKRNFH